MQKRMQHPGEKRTADQGFIMPPGLDAEEGGPLVAPPHGGGRRSTGRAKKQERPAPLPRGPDPSGGVYVISVVARLLEMHPQTLRKYERLGLVTPTRSLGMLRLYSAEDIVRVRLIKYMVDDLGMNLAGVEFALSFLNRVVGLGEKIQAVSQANALHQLLSQELEGMLGELGVDLPRAPRAGSI
ncbi:MAG: HspR [Dehalococcoidia bacterium]|nr:HspR [Dehalococcoidia bacterium]